ncbi:hypothetical protein ONK20_24595, partial [Salmonella enterica subsp. enterica serovar Montevideo]|nr:hypothetical protein [Salmonella enterica subsp. enterica serovar Montevideo]
AAQYTEDNEIWAGLYGPDSSKTDPAVNCAAGYFPSVEALDSLRAIHRLHELGVDTMHGVGFGEKGVNPLTRTSFIITEDLTPTIS